MPNPPKSDAEKLQFGVTVLFNRRQIEAIQRIMDRDSLGRGQAIRTLVDRGIKHDPHN